MEMSQGQLLRSNLIRYYGRIKNIPNCCTIAKMLGIKTAHLKNILSDNVRISRKTSYKLAAKLGPLNDPDYYYNHQINYELEAKGNPSPILKEFKKLTSIQEFPEGYDIEYHFDNLNYLKAVLDKHGINVNAL